MRIQKGYPPTVDRTVVRSSALSSFLYSGMALDPELRPQDAETFRKLLLNACQFQVCITLFAKFAEHTTERSRNTEHAINNKKHKTQ